MQQECSLNYTQKSKGNKAKPTFIISLRICAFLKAALSLWNIWG